MSDELATPERVIPAEDDLLLSAAEQALLSSVGSPVVLAAGETLFRRGEDGSSMYVVASGMVELMFGDEAPRKRIGPSGFFGELGLLIGGHTRSASVRALTDCLLHEVRHELFHELLERESFTLAQFLHRAIVRVVRNEQWLMNNLRRRNGDLESALDSLRRTTDQLTHTRVLTRTDELTGLLNRRGFVADIEDLRLQDSLRQCALLVVDCDAFKQVNDRHGHAAGDRVLQSVAHILRSITGNADVVARLGGDEFCLLVHLQEPGELTRVAEYLVTTAESLYEMQDDPPLMCRLSIGACRIDAALDWQDWYECAGAALYRVKARGGSGYEVSVRSPHPGPLGKRP